ncbi:MAG: ABC transporter permease [Candidatus Promineifilaceae bacterium]
MVQYIVRRLLETIPVLLIVTFIVFTLMFLAPGDPVYLLVDFEQLEGLDQEQLEILRHEKGLDRSIFVQYGDWLGQALQGDLGHSVFGNRRVVDMITSAFPVSMELALLSMIFALIVAIPVGVYVALKPNSLGDLLGSSMAIAGISAPGFWVALILIFVFAVQLDWLPSGGFVRFSEDPKANLERMILPALTLGIALMASVMRMTRSGMLEVMHQDYVRTARAKGAGERRVIFRHAFQNAILPVLTIIGLQFGVLLGGAVVIEQIFTIPGMGRLGLDAIFSRDFPVVQGVVLVVTLTFLMVNLLVDLLYGVLDPRIRLS